MVDMMSADAQARPVVWASAAVMLRIVILFLSVLFLELENTVYPKKYAHGFCFAVLCCGCTLTDFPISIRLTSLALCQSNDCPSASKATLMNMDKYFMWIHYERLHNHNKGKHNKTVVSWDILYITNPHGQFNVYWCPDNTIIWTSVAVVLMIVKPVLSFNVIPSEMENTKSTQMVYIISADDCQSCLIP